MSVVLTGVCGEDEFTCPAEGECIPINAICNGVADCEGGLDEYSCGTFKLICIVFGYIVSFNTTTINKVCWEYNLPCSICDELTFIRACVKNTNQFLFTLFYANAGLCGDTFFNLTDVSPVTLISPAWPEIYPDLVECLYLLKTEPGFRVVLAFLAFETELGYDKLRMGNGDDHTEELILELSGCVDVLLFRKKLYFMCIYHRS